MSTNEIQMLWRMMCAIMPACIEQGPHPSEISESFPDLDSEAILRIHQNACSEMAYDYAFAALRLILAKGDQNG